MFMGNDVTNKKKLVLADGNLKTPSPLSSDSDQHGSSESLLSEINEVYQSIETNYPLNKSKSSKDLGVSEERQETNELSDISSHSSSPSSLKKRLSNIPHIIPEVPDCRGIIKDVVFDLQLKKNQIDETDESIVWENTSESPKSSLNAESLAMNDARARRRAKLHTSSPEKSFRGTWSDDDRLKSSAGHTTSERINFALKNVQEYDDEALVSGRQFKGRLRSHPGEESPSDIQKKPPALLNQINLPMRRKKRRKNEVITSPSLSLSTSPEPSHRTKTVVSQLNLQNIQSAYESMSSDRDQTDDQRNQEIDELVETLSNRPFRSTVRKRSSDDDIKMETELGDDGLRTFRVKANDLQENLKDELAWALKPTSAMMDLFSSKSDIQMNNYLKSYSNASTQINIKSSIPQIHRTSKLSQRKDAMKEGYYIDDGVNAKDDTFSVDTKTLNMKKDEFLGQNDNSAVKNQGFDIKSDVSHAKSMSTEMVYQSQTWPGSSSSGEITPHYTPSRITKYPLIKAKKESGNDGKWALGVSLPSAVAKHHLHDRYSVFVIQAAPGITISRQLEGLHGHSVDLPVNLDADNQKNSLNSPVCDDEQELTVDECFCLKFCNLFRYTSHN